MITLAPPGCVWSCGHAVVRSGRLQRRLHRFWEASEEGDQAQQRIHFLKNLSMFGGLLIAAADTAGNPSLAWRTRHAAKTARLEASLVARTAKTTGKASAKAGRRPPAIA